MRATLFLIFLIVNKSREKTKNHHLSVSRHFLASLPRLWLSARVLLVSTEDGNTERHKYKALFPLKQLNKN